MTRWCILTVGLWMIVTVCGKYGLAATFCVRPNVTASSNLITLGDVVAIEDCDPQTHHSLASLPLFPAPPMGEAKFVSRDEIRELLILRGIDLRMHTWSGALQVKIITSPSAPVPAAEKKNPSQLSSLAQERLQAVLDEYWRRVFPEGPKYRFEFTLSDQDVNWFSAVDARLTIKDVQPLAPDAWAVVVQTQVGQEQRVANIQVKLRCPSQVVLAARSLSRDVIISPADVVASEDTESSNSENAMGLEEVIGKQLTIAIPAGKPIPRSALRDPIVVRRGETVQVIVRAPGVTVRTVGRAKDDGAVSYLVPIETFESKGKTLMARVVGPKEVEVYAAGIQAR